MEMRSVFLPPKSAGGDGTLPKLNHIKKEKYASEMWNNNPGKIEVCCLVFVPLDGTSKILEEKRRRGGHIKIARVNMLCVGQGYFEQFAAAVGTNSHKKRSILPELGRG